MIVVVKYRAANGRFAKFRKGRKLSKEFWRGPERIKAVKPRKYARRAPPSEIRRIEKKKFPISSKWNGDQPYDRVRVKYTIHRSNGTQITRWFTTIRLLQSERGYPTDHVAFIETRLNSMIVSGGGEITGIEIVSIETTLGGSN